MTSRRLVLIPRQSPAFNTVLMTAFGLLSLLLAAIGVYGLLAYLVERRTREVGLRIALGASPRTVRNLVVTQGMKLVAAGVVLGVIGALVLGRVLKGFLFGVTPTDPAVLIVTSCVLGGAAFVATLFPAWRASRVSPIVALRAE